MALQAISRQQRGTEIARNFHCSRTTVHAQKNRALEAAANEFRDAADDGTLFIIPVTRSFIQQMVVGLFCICNSSYRGIMSFPRSIFDYPVALGSVFNILDAAASKAAVLNEAYELRPIRSSAADEVFHRNQPILSIVDIESRFCALLARADDRDHETWATICLIFRPAATHPTQALWIVLKVCSRGTPTYCQRQAGTVTLLRVARALR